MSPSLSNVAVSKIKVEKVVNAPQNPTINKALELGERAILFSEIIVRNPITKQPSKLTAIVPYGKEEPKVLINMLEIKYLAKVPIIPPRAKLTKNIDLITTHF